MKTTVGITPIEKAFYDMSKLEHKLQEYFFTYYSQKLILLNHFYPHISEKLPGYNDHGPDHVIRIMKLYEHMLGNNVPMISQSDSIPSGTTLNFYELYLLLCATVWHDVGNLFGRTGHQERIKDVLKRLKNHFFVDSNVCGYALQIAKSHTGEDGIRESISYEDVDYMNEEINLRFLGAILRLADELEEGEVRIDAQYYDTMDMIPEDQKIYWEISRCIKRIRPDPNNSTINIRTKMKKDNLFKIYKKNINGKIGDVALIDELIFRIDKMNHERRQYMQFVRKHIDYRDINLELIIESAEPQTHTFKFDNDRNYGSFWRNNSELNPENTIDGYINQKGGRR